ncbi:MAG: superoxide dismutase family protein [Sphingomicrobium sp.]
MRLIPLAATLSMSLAACTTVHGPPESRLTNADGIQTGTVRAWNAPGGVAIDVLASGLAPGPHAIHVHTSGRCDRPFFTTAGPHLNPSARKHGHSNPAGPHMGDLGNMMAGPDGRGHATVLLAGASLESLKDFDGASLVVHARADDERTDPSGNSGDRVACALIL